MRTTIQQPNTTTQGSRMDVLELNGFGYAGKMLVHSLLREYGECHDCSFYVHLNDLDITDKKLLLSYVAEDAEYEEALASPNMLNAYIKEYSPLMQRLLDQESDEAYRDVMEEAATYYGD